MNDDQPVNTNTPNGTDDGQQTVDANLQDKEKLAALQEQNKKLYARAKTAEGFIPDPQNEGKWIKKPVVQAPISERVEPQKPSDILRSPEFVLHREGFNENEIDIIMKNGGREILKDEKNPITMGLRVAREQRSAETAAGRLSDTSGQSEIERKYTPEQMRAMTKEDLEKLIGFAPGS